MLKIQLKLYIFYQFYLFYKNLSNHLNQMQIHTFLKHEIIPVFPVFMTPIATPCQIMIIGPDYIKKWCWILCSAPFFIKPVNIIFQKKLLLFPAASKSAFKIFIPKISKTFHGFIAMSQPYIRQRHSIKGIVLAGCINGHITKHENVSILQRL